MIQRAKRLEGIEEYYFSKKIKELEQLRNEGKDIINLGIGSPDLPPAPAVIKALEESTEEPNNHGYQAYRGLPALREKISQWYAQYYQVKLDPTSEILPLTGSKEGIMHICMTYLEAGDAVLIPDPGYPTYAACAKISGATVITYDLKEERDWQPDLEKIARENDLNKVKIMWVNYPHMPSGKKAHPTLFKRLSQFGKQHNILIVNDNPYSFTLNDQQESLLNEGLEEHLLELNSLSKSHNMAGWRIGMLIGYRKHIDNVLKFKSNMDSGIFKGLQEAAIAALSLEKDWFEQLDSYYAKRQKIAFEILKHLKCHYSEEQVGMFVWGKCPTSYSNAEELSDKILDQASVFITPGFIFGENGKSYIRISLCTNEQKLTEALKRIKEIKDL